jgi:hypothetical protein
MIRRDIAVINQSSVLTDERGLSITKALAAQIHNDYAPLWGTDARLTYVPLGSAPPPGKWWLMLMDNSDEAGALGYHDLNPSGLPQGKVFARTDERYGNDVGVTASHEILEMLGDPYINLTVMVNQGNTMLAYAYENCDACEADQFAYEVLGEKVSDFVLPAYFDPSPVEGRQLDFRNQITSPFEILAGGYLSQWTVTGGWQQLHGSQRAIAGDRPKVGSRRDRRRTPRRDWLVSDPIDWQSGDPLFNRELYEEPVD